MFLIWVTRNFEHLIVSMIIFNYQFTMMFFAINILWCVFGSDASEGFVFNVLLNDLTSCKQKWIVILKLILWLLCSFLASASAGVRFKVVVAM